MRNRNWRQYNKHLVQQGSISFLIDPKIFKSMQKNQRLKGRGRPIQFSDALIEMLLMIKTQSFLIPTSGQLHEEFPMYSPLKVSIDTQDSMQQPFFSY